MNNLHSDERIFRNELKYLCSEKQLQLMEMRIRPICRPDPHTGAEGKYTVRSVYFDDFRDTCYYENEDGVNDRRKFRIRIYNGRPEPILLECKQKQNGKNHKDACVIDEELCRSILSGHFPTPKEAPPVLNRFFLQYATAGYRPKVIVEYERTPFIYPAGNVRITFDRNISATAKVGDFFESRLALRPLMQTGMHLLEVKFDELLPDHIYTQLQLDNLQCVAHSKYYTARKMTKDSCI